MSGPRSELKTLVNNVTPRSVPMLMYEQILVLRSIEARLGEIHELLGGRLPRKRGRPRKRAEAGH